MTHFYLSVHWTKKISHFDLKNWVKFFFCQWFIFVGQNDPFLAQCMKRKNWVILTKKFGSNFSSTSDSIFFRSEWLTFSLGARSEKIESFWPKNLGQILVPPVIQFFRSKWLIFSLGARSEKIESVWPKNFGQILVKFRLISDPTGHG